mmetsp:Transcript_8765/g.14397  ORF Transcript_8765/g.14397 Transcript_8765/m.14397 type:complete len:289 (+) Transcript_8765:55-921(+)|eukprot:CAMPEP_0184653766 /NCGR_PEP_ID=MMETSP0308-20130426/11484_1 /TAXON_ID=38269 /ORGANISM="Gloeochaete witrockiana, Strain SAG 46.84" /LENGTH=288 /DNA_ID=CAMNT_0027089405 /DNA_START=18 /DNA_END=884 /DNA_ORIENTATION=+
MEAASTSSSSVRSKRSERANDVLQWARSLAGNSDFEINEDTIAILGRFYDVNVAVECLREEIQDRAKFYQTEADRLEDLSKAAGISPKTLSNDGRALLSCLSHAADLLGVQPLPENYVLALDDLMKSSSIAKERRAAERYRLDQLRKDYENSREVLSKLSKSLQEIERKYQEEDSPNASRNVDQAMYLKHKCVEYEEQCKRLRETIWKNGFVSELSHDELKATQDRIDALHSQIEPMLLKLKSYHDLPPDIQLATGKLEEKRAELLQIEAEVNKNIFGTVESFGGDFM